MSRAFDFLTAHTDAADGVGKAFRVEVCADVMPGVYQSGGAAVFRVLLLFIYK